VLLEAWLPDDDNLRGWIVETLVEYGLGDMSIDVEILEGQMAYLRSCRNAGTLRTVVLAAFQALGEPDDAVSGNTDRQDVVGSGSSERSTMDGADGNASAAVDGPDASDSDASFSDWLLRTLSEQFEVAIERDIDGDIPIPRGSSVTYLRVDPDTPILHMFAPVVSQMPTNPAVFEAINTINLQLSIVHALVVEDGTGVVLGASVPADSLSTESLFFFLDQVSGAADYYDTLIVERFGGTTMLEDDPEGSVDV